jgi:hypothetical protein
MNPRRACGETSIPPPSLPEFFFIDLPPSPPLGNIIAEMRNVRLEVNASACTNSPSEARKGWFIKLKTSTLV